MKTPAIYVEIEMATSMAALWEHTQSPAQHERWDLRFSRIDYLPRPDPAEPQRFTYRTRIGFGAEITGTGESVGTVEAGDGRRTSALAFRSADPRSLIREGSGYWQYLPLPDGRVRFLTRYDYDVRFGAAGRVFDRLAFRPLIGWATAWSFDRLRLWLERGQQPDDAWRLAAAHALARLGLASAWLYQGLVPKLLAPDSSERAIMLASGVPGDLVAPLQALLGVAEILFGVATLFVPVARPLFLLTAGLLIALLIGAGVGTPGLLTAAFNPVSLTLTMLALAAVGWAVEPAVPRARRCRRQPRRGDA